jgi:hypothetical protein
LPALQPVARRALSEFRVKVNSRIIPRRGDFLETALTVKAEENLASRSHLGPSCEFDRNNRSANICGMQVAYGAFTEIGPKTTMHSILDATTPLPGPGIPERET